MVRAAFHRFLAMLILAAACQGIPAAADADDVDCKLTTLDRRLRGDDRYRSRIDVDCLRQHLDALRHDQDRLARQLQELAERELAARRTTLEIDGEMAEGVLFAPPYTAIVSSRAGHSPVSSHLDRNALDERCGDPDGCILTLGLGGVVAGDRVFPVTFLHGPCLFQIDPTTGAWTLTTACASREPPGDIAGLPAQADDPAWGWGAASQAPRRARPDTPALPPDEPAKILLGVAGACFLAEGPPARRLSAGQTRGLRRDPTRDLHLIAGALPGTVDGQFPAAHVPEGEAFDCVLTLRD